jgi:hypothetical protein
MSFHELGIPASSSTVTVKAFDLIDDPGAIKLPASAFFQPVIPGHENLRCPDFAFLIESQSTKKRVMFDLGSRKDLENAAPCIAEQYKSGAIVFPVNRDIVEQLRDAGVALESISAVIWR